MDPLLATGLGSWVREEHRRSDDEAESAPFPLPKIRPCELMVLQTFPASPLALFGLLQAGPSCCRISTSSNFLLKVVALCHVGQLVLI